MEISIYKLKRDLNEYNGELISYRTNNNLIGICVDFGNDSYWNAKEFEEKHSEWKATTNCGDYYELIYLNDKGKNILRKKGFEIY